VPHFARVAPFQTSLLRRIGARTRFTPFTFEEHGRRFRNFCRKRLGQIDTAPSSRFPFGSDHVSPNCLIGLMFE
jgi:hypothetical protein